MSPILYEQASNRIEGFQRFDTIARATTQAQHSALDRFEEINGKSLTKGAITIDFEGWLRSLETSQRLTALQVDAGTVINKSISERTGRGRTQISFSVIESSVAIAGSTEMYIVGFDTDQLYDPRDLSTDKARTEMDTMATKAIYVSRMDQSSLSAKTYHIDTYGKMSVDGERVNNDEANNAVKEMKDIIERFSYKFND